ncbi:hypothetical protein [Actinoplanes sp. TFC3]|uniref:hypothetical protein n=1 Tax=Actinoplanes sp. TFC3 TaxID=1710355 RepID=UPI00082C1CDB|nr:hypothetical protein [Actinoplanes sp. TFC3]
MRILKFLSPLLALPLAVGGCSALGLGSSGQPGGSASATPNSGPGWIVYATGSATPSPVVRYSGSRPPALPSVSFLPADPGCSTAYEVDPVLIPVTVTPGKGRLTVTWPRQYDSDYRIAAVKQPLISGAQPNYKWQYVPTPPGCTATATITGLKSGTPYIVWLDAPNTGYERDGTRHPYSGRSGVVYPL